MPVAVFVLGVAAGLEVMSYKMLLIMSVISFGVLVASYGEININWIGVVYQMGGVVGEALRLIFMEIFVKRKGLKLNPISVMYYVSPCRQVFLLVISLTATQMFEYSVNCELIPMKIILDSSAVQFVYSFHGYFWRNQRWMNMDRGTSHLFCLSSTAFVLLL